MPGATLIDIAHISFLEVIRALIDQSGAANAKGTLVRLAVKVGGRIPPVDFVTMSDFVKATDAGSNPIARIEGKAVHYGNGLFGLPVCPFAASIGSYRSVFNALPDSYAEATAEFNKPSPITGEHRVGHGAGVSPFCAVHQPMRSAAVGQITIGGKPLVAYQLGCKSAAGKKGLAEPLIAAAGYSSAEVEKILDTNMCCYCLKVVN